MRDDGIPTTIIGADNYEKWQTPRIDLANHTLHIDGVTVGALIGRLGSGCQESADVIDLSGGGRGRWHIVRKRQTLNVRTTANGHETRVKSNGRHAGDRGTSGEREKRAGAHRVHGRSDETVLATAGPNEHRVAACGRYRYRVVPEPSTVSGLRLGRHRRKHGPDHCQRDDRIRASRRNQKHPRWSGNGRLHLDPTTRRACDQDDIHGDRRNGLGADRRGHPCSERSAYHTPEGSMRDEAARGTQPSCRTGLRGPHPDVQGLAEVHGRGARSAERQRPNKLEGKRSCTCRSTDEHSTDNH